MCRRLRGIHTDEELYQNESVQAGQTTREGGAKRLVDTAPAAVTNATAADGKRTLHQQHPQNSRELLEQMLQSMAQEREDRRQQHIEQMKTPRSRLIGESDVLAAVTSEYLDENASKKDTSAATVCLGRVFMTTFRFQFVPDEHEYDHARRHLLDRSEEEIKSFFLIPLGCIASVKKKNSIVEIFTKDLRQLSFRFDVIEITKIFSVLTTYVFPDKTEFLFAFYHRLSENMLEEEPLLPCLLDWDVYDDQAEWKRQGVLLDAMNFRSLGRIPCLTWLNGVNGATLCRSSQPKVGMSKATSSADESLVAGIASSNPLREQLQIIDCRPMSSALANRAKGYGVESSVNYKNCTVSFMEIPNIHSMRESMRKLRNLCASPSCDNLRWLGSVEDTKWLVYIRQLLKAALHVAALLRSGESVLLHCSHGWDRTSQIASLAQIFVDPYFRTWKGFQVLIEKEWLSFGHPFHLRHSHGEKADTQESPIFIQFLSVFRNLFESTRPILSSTKDSCFY
ncbi:unnamed protein product [Peronospora destructor]|uniref:Myotubularin phosphatase domain-containing protein n=1 Tax=Peronospora destructor TaxID=86335 RepID=A0AAV0VAR1_9STRA|nr:unnamed protein product [Peronospora destructor]